VSTHVSAEDPAGGRLRGFTVMGLGKEEHELAGATEQAPHGTRTEEVMFMTRHVLDAGRTSCCGFGT